VRRWTAAEKQASRASAPSPELPRVGDAILDELARGYEHITGDAVRSIAKRGLIALCYRIHGEAFLPHVQRIFARTGTATNLLWEIRCLEPSVDRPAVEEPPAAGEATPETASEALPGHIYPADDRPPFDPTSTRRYDRRPSNPDAAAFFTDEELGVRPDRSPTAEALSR
jgi:hypothetical protein